MAASSASTRRRSPTSNCSVPIASATARAAQVPALRYNSPAVRLIVVYETDPVSYLSVVVWHQGCSAASDVSRSVQIVAPSAGGRPVTEPDNDVVTVASGQFADVMRFWNAMAMGQDQLRCDRRHHHAPPITTPVDRRQKTSENL